MNTLSLEVSRDRELSLDMLQEAGYCAAAEGLDPDACEEYLAATDEEKAVWLEGWQAARAHQMDVG